MKKYLLTIIFSMFLLTGAYAIAIDIPQVLKDLGYSNEDLVDYRKENDKEYYILKNWNTRESTDTITFVIEEGEITNWQTP